MTKLLLAAGISLSALTSAQAAVDRVWSDNAVMPVTQMHGDGENWATCETHTANVSGAAWELSVGPDGKRSFHFTFGSGFSKPIAGTLTLVIDGQYFWLDMVTSGGNWLRSDGLNDTLLHALYNGTTLRVQQYLAPGTPNTPTWIQPFDLTGSATAIAILNQCAATIATGTISSEQQAAIDRIKPAPGWPGASQAISDHVEAPLRRNGGIYEVDVLVNGMPMTFGVDSGAGDVSITRAAMAHMLITGAVKDSDYLGDQTYVLADGTKRKDPVYSLASIVVGGRAITNVRASVSDGLMLLGQSFLEKFHSWSIDNARSVLVLN